VIAEDQKTMWSKTDDLGVCEQYDQNAKVARRAGLERCHHCGKGLKPGKGWLVHVTSNTSPCTFFRMDVTEEQAAAEFGRSEWIKLGSECGRSLPAAFRKHLP
jgi:hypothetical protein